MPLVLARSQRAEDAHLKSMRNQAAARHRNSRLTLGSKTAAAIEYKQKAYYERSSKTPQLPEPKADAGWSSPEWDVSRACWLSYSVDDTSRWVCWDALNGKWVDILEFDRACSSPDSDQSKSERVSPSNTDLSARSDTPGSTRPKLSFRTVAQGIIKLLALKGQKSESDGSV